MTDKSSLIFKSLIDTIVNTKLDSNNYIKALFDKNHVNMSFTKLNSKAICNTIKDSFQKTHEDILDRSFDTNYSGTTVCSVFIYGKVLFCANVGDSRAIIGRQENDKWMSLALSKDHKPDNIEEKKRILNKNGRVEAYKSKFSI